MRPSRAMISGELFAAYVALCFAWSGAGAWPLDPGPLAELVAEHAHPLVWGLSLGLPAIALIVVGAIEWIAHDVSSPRCWLERIALAHWHGDLRSACVRGKLCLALVLGWLYMAKLTLSTTSGANASSLVAVGGVVFCIAYYTENRRVQREIRSQMSAAFDAHPAR